MRIALHNDVEKLNVRKILFARSSASAALAIFAALSAIFTFIALNASASVPTTTTPRPTKAQMKAQLRTSARTQEMIQTVLERLQKLKSDHIAKTKLATANDKLVLAIYDRLIMVIEARYKSGDLADFLSTYSLQMAETEKRNDSNLAEFFLYLGDVVKSAKNDRSDIISTIEHYIRSSPVDDPLTAVRFILNNSYSNGSTNERAVGFAREDAVEDDSQAAAITLPVEEATILPQIETPRLLPPGYQDEVEPEAMVVVAPATPALTSNTIDKMNEPMPEETPAPELTTPSSDSSAPSAQPVANTPSAGSQAPSPSQEPKLAL